MLFYYSDTSLSVFIRLIRVTANMCEKKNCQNYRNNKINKIRILSLNTCVFMYYIHRYLLICFVRFLYKMRKDNCLASLGSGEL